MATFKLRQFQWFVLAGIVAVLYYDILYKWGINLWEDDNYSHGLLIPFVSLYFIWQKIPQLRSAKTEPNNLGLAVILGGILLYLLGFVSAELFTKRFSLLVVLWGLVLFLEGAQRGKLLLFPISILFFAIPLPYVLYNSVAFPLKLISTRIAVWLLGIYGMPVFSEGNIVHLQHTTLEVVDACSGVRSLMTLITLAFFLAYFWLDNFFKRILVILLAVPIAVLANGARVALNGVMTKYMPDFTESFWHEFSGWLLFIICFAILFGISVALDATKKLFHRTK